MRITPPNKLVIASLAVALADCITCYRASPWLALIAIASITIAPIIAKQYRLAWTLAILFFCVGLYAEIRYPRPASTDIAKLANAGTVRFRGIVLAINNQFTGDTKPITIATVQATELAYPVVRPLSGRIRISIVDDSFLLLNTAIKPHTRVEIEGKISVPKQAEHPWELDSKKMLERRRIFCQMRVVADRVKTVNPKGGFELEDLYSYMLSLIDSVRHSIVGMHQKNLGNERGGLLSSIVLGEAAVGLDDDTQKLFRDTGLSHLLAASGFNLTIIVASAYFIAKAISKNNSFVAWVSLAAVVGFVSLAGNSPSVMRAAIMCALVIASKWGFRRLHMGAALACSLLLSIMHDPICITDIGFQLSYVATAGILLGAQPLSNVLQRYSKSDVFNPLCDLVAVILVAQLSVLPFQLFYFWQAGLLFLPANIAVDPFIVPITSIGFVSSLAAPLSTHVHGLSEICWGLDQVTGMMLNCILHTLKLMTSLGDTQLRGAPHLMALIFNSLAGILLLLSLAFSRGQKTSFSIYFLSLLLFIWPQPLPKLSVAATEKQVSVVFSNRKITSFRLHAHLDDSHIRRYLRYLGAAEELVVDCNSNTIATESSTQLQHGSKTALKYKTAECGIVYVGYERQRTSLYYLSGLPEKIDDSEAAKFAENCRCLNPLGKDELIIARTSRVSSQRQRMAQEQQIRRIALAISPDATVLVLNPRGKGDRQMRIEQQLSREPLSRICVSTGKIALATLE